MLPERFITGVGALLLIVVLSVLPVSSMAEHERTDPVKQDAPVYPNPARDFIFFRADKVYNFTGDISLKVVDILGNPVKVQPEKVGYNTYRINVSQCAAGYYMLVAQCKTDTETKKKVFRFLKQ
ncbi:T9SS type A sorting domain-containing protein [Tunicatimonas pelagia]|uniref:T9SS type A sorting domain-containing protein n=1 Tax=Tunicatimonas pelagia TaxID=931531 RepID=UPI00266542B5|nr:T9SS type A sorting domain-containing protein [Tunicatimonas pelagia]WKN40934.1 T9SS type A sorting domain-containing protein [Tunicatimonas pelagia]